MEKSIIKISLIMFSIGYLLLIVFFNLPKRTTFSISEGRETKNFPEFNVKKYLKGDFNRELDEFFVDTVPNRDAIVDAAIYIKKFKGIADDGISIINVENKTGYNDDFFLDSAIIIATNNIITQDQNNIKKEIPYTELADEQYSFVQDTDSGNRVVITGEKEKVRGLSIYASDLSFSDNIAEVVNNSLKPLLDAFENLNVYYMLIPLPCAYYLPKKLESSWFDQRKFMEEIYAKVDRRIKCVPIYDILFEHKDEDIYFRTDSHWTQRGAYYAGIEFAKIAGVDYPSLEYYDDKVIKNYCGSYYRYTEEPRLKQYPDEFHYFVPQTEFTTTQIHYTKDLNNNRYVVSTESDASFFYEKEDGDTWAYMTYMGGDSNTTVVKTNNNTGRKLAIVKDSFGNPFVPNTFFSFDEVHVIDFRYFKDNLLFYIYNNGITDLIFESQLSMALTQAGRYKALCTQTLE